MKRGMRATMMINGVKKLGGIKRNRLHDFCKWEHKKSVTEL